MDAETDSSISRREVATTLRAIWRSGGRRALDMVLPPVCALTGEPVARTQTLSAAGWSRLSFVEDPVCARCGVPFAYEQGAGAVCAGCAAEPPAFDAARAAVLYDDAAHDLIVAFKHRDRTDLAPLLAGWLARAGAGWFSANAVLAPVPLHPSRLFKRRYNQSALLANLVAKAQGLTVDVAALVRVKPTKSQQGLSAEGRRRNLQGAIAPNPERPRALEGRDAIIVDDVHTTGATLSAAARAARAAGAARVYGLVLARAVRNGAGYVEGEGVA